MSRQMTPQRNRTIRAAVVAVLQRHHPDGLSWSGLVAALAPFGIAEEELDVVAPELEAEGVTEVEDDGISFIYHLVDPHLYRR